MSGIWVLSESPPPPLCQNNITSRKSRKHRYQDTCDTEAAKLGLPQPKTVSVMQL